MLNAMEDWILTSEKYMNIAYLSTYPPRECGLATFTENLIFHMSKLHATRQSKVIAVSNKSLRYDDHVIMELAQNNRPSYQRMASRLYNSDIELLVIEHEFGIYGGEWGEYILDLVDNLQIPFVTTLHTVLQEPNEMQRHIIHVLGKKGKKVITMAKNSAPTLVHTYGIDPSKIAVINHGVPYIPMKSRERLKEEFGLENRTIVSTFGLLGPGKGLEYGVEAIAKVAKSHKEILYFILGQTHPAIKNESGEEYRNTLRTLVEKLGVEDNVRFINKYLTEEEIIRYLKLSDIYLTPYLNKDQAVSGTLAYAAGYGRVIVSTPYSYAKEMLSDGRGLLAEFRDSASIAGCIEYVLDHPEEKRQMEQKMLELGKTMTWEYVAQQYKALFSDVLTQHRKYASSDKLQSRMSGNTVASL